MFLSFSKLLIVEKVWFTRQFSSTSLLNERIKRRRTPSTQPKSEPLHGFKRAEQLLLRKDYKQIFKTDTKSITLLKSKGYSIPSKLLSKIITSRGLDLDTFNVFVDILRRKDLVHALTSLGLLESAGLLRNQLNCPNWLFLFLPGLIQSQSQVPYLISLLRLPCDDYTTNTFSQLKRSEKGIFISRCIQHCLKVKHYIAVRELVEWITHPSQTIILGLDLDDSISTIFYSRCLTALTLSSTNSFSSPPSNFLHPLTSLLRQSMATRSITPTNSTYSPLFSASLVPKDPKQASLLLIEMNQLGLKIESEQLNAVLGAFASKGDEKGANKVLQLIKQNNLDSKIELSEVRASKLKEKKKVLKNLVPLVQKKAGTMVQKDTSTTLKSSSSTLPLNSLNRTTPSHTYNTTFLSSLKADPEEALSWFSNLQTESPESIDSITWTTLLQLICSHRYSTSKEILEMLVAFEKWFNNNTPLNATKGSARTRRIIKLGILAAGKIASSKLLPVENYLIVFKSLLYRNSIKELLNLWNELQSRGLKADVHLIDIISRAYYANNDMEGGMRFIRYHAFRPQFDSIPSTTTSTRSSITFRGRPFNHRPTRLSVSQALTQQPHSVKLDITIINSLLSTLARTSNYSEVYSIFSQSLYHEFGIGPHSSIDIATVTILLDSARFASAEAGRGYGPGILNIDYDPFERKDDNWGGKSACRFMEEFVWNMLDCGWIEGREWVKRNNCLEGVKNKAEDNSKSSIFNLLRSSSTLSSSPPIFFQSTLALSTTPPPLYPQLYPSQKLFSHFLNLLGYHSTPSSVARAFTWMRYLDIKPSRKDLVLGMMYIHESGLGETERRNLNAWMVDWLGESGVVSEIALAALRSGGNGGRRFVKVA